VTIIVTKILTTTVIKLNQFSDESCITISRRSEQAVTHFREWHEDSSQYTPCRGRLDNMTHVWSQRPSVWQQLTMAIKESVRAHLTLVYVFHVISLRSIHGWPIHYPGLHHCRYGRIVSDSATISATMFMGPHKSRMHQYTINACLSGPTQCGP
jgi:hypothetical protein